MYSREQINAAKEMSREMSMIDAKSTRELAMYFVGKRDVMQHDTTAPDTDRRLLHLEVAFIVMTVVFSLNLIFN